MPEIVRASALRATRRPDQHTPKCIVLDPETLRALQVDASNKLFIGRVEADVTGLPCDIYVVLERARDWRFKPEMLRADEPPELLTFNAEARDMLARPDNVNPFDPNKRPA